MYVDIYIRTMNTFVHISCMYMYMYVSMYIYIRTACSVHMYTGLRYTHARYFWLEPFSWNCIQKHVPCTRTT